MVHNKEIDDYIKNNLLYDPDIGELHWTCEGGFNRDISKTAGTVLGDGYKAISTTFGVIKVHRICWYLHYGYWPDNYLDHVDGDKTNNRITNLRLVTNQQNSFNSKPHKDGSSKYKGVTFDKKNGKWFSRICRDGKTKFLGYFTEEKDAAIAYNKAAKELFGEYCWTNDV